VPSDYLVRNNIVVDNGIGLSVDFDKGPTWDHNLVYGNTTDYSGISDQTGSSGNLRADPLFVGSATNDFHLSAGSAAIAAGSDFNAPHIDFDGDGRPTGEVDIGAFQYEGVPSPPQPVAAVPYGDGGAKVIWTRPGRDGGSAITGYRVTPYLGLVAQPAREFGSAATFGLVTGLQDGKQYRFFVAARNATGIGASSPITLPIIVGAPGQPGKPAMVRVAPGALQATFSAPNNNGAVITSYAVTCASSNGGATKSASGSRSPITVSALTPGKSYTCTVSATNSRGTGPASAASAPANA
jgi:hypothetical protein